MKHAVRFTSILLAVSIGFGGLVGCSHKRKPAGTAAGDPSQPANWKPGENKKAGENPFDGAKWYINPYGTAVVAAKAARMKGNAQDANLIDKIARYGGAEWVGDWTAYVDSWIQRTTTAVEKQGALPLYVAYNLPNRDCGQYSTGGSTTGDAYKKWISDFARGIGARKAVIILEPDALGQLKTCLSEKDQEVRLSLFRYAIETFNSLPQTYVYVDGGHSAWLPAEEAAARLKAAGVEQAQGFSLNVSNYRSTPELIEYGKKVSALLGGKHFVLDTSRNGNGPLPDSEGEKSWCNPPGRALGSPPTSKTADPLCDAYLWLKKPGESDGTCNGGPKAGDWWQEKALELARNAKF
jgi:endoglucanase